MGAANHIVLAILVTAFLHSLSAAVDRYPYPFDCHKYYIVFTDGHVSLNACPNSFYFNQYTNLCQAGVPDRFIVGLGTGVVTTCPSNFPLLTYFCGNTDTFTYCKPGSVVPIVKNVPCPPGGCGGCLDVAPC